MRYLLPLVFCLLSSSAWSQIYFKYDYRDCDPVDLCMYCGDSVARPTVKLDRYIQKQLNRNMFEYNGVGRKMLFQVYIDETGKPCIISADHKFDHRLLRNDIRAIINHMPNWKPAIKDGKAIGSGIIIEFTFHNDYMDVRYISKMRKTDGRVI